MTNIHESDETTEIITNSGMLTTSHKGELENYGLVWYHPDSIMNILSIDNLTQRYRVSFDNEREDKFIVHKPEGNQIFPKTQHGLYRFDTRDSRNYAFLDTMDVVKSQ